MKFKGIKIIMFYSQSDRLKLLLRQNITLDNVCT